MSVTESMAPATAAEGFALARQPGHLLRLAQQRAVELFLDELGEAGPTPRQFAVLVTVLQHPGINQTGLVRRTGIDRSTLTEIIRRLLARALVRRERVAIDQRANALFLTEAGAALVAAAMPAVDRAQARILAPVPPERRAALLELLALLAGDAGEGSADPGSAGAPPGLRRRSAGGAERNPR